MTERGTPTGLMRTAVTRDEFLAMSRAGSPEPHDGGPTRALRFVAYVDRRQFEGLMAYLESHAIRVEYRTTEKEERDGRADRGA